MAGRRDIEAGSAYVRLYMKQTAIERGIKDLQRKLRSVGKGFQEVGRTAMLAGAAVVAGLALATNTFAGFDDQMRAVQAVTGSVGQDFDQLTEKAKELGRTTSYTAAQVASGMLNLGRAGFKPGEIDASIADILNLARATGTELPEAAEIAAGTLRAFSMDASEMTRVADVLTATANNSAQTLSELGDSMKYAAPIADEYGLSIEQTSKLLGVLANMQIKGSMAGTAMRKIMGSLANVDVQNKLRELGVETLDATGNLRSLGDVMLDIGDAMSRMTGAQRISLAQELFGERAYGGALKLAKGGFDDLSRAIDNAGGSAAETAETMDAGIGGAIRKFLSAVEGVQIAIGEALSGAVEKYGEKLTSVAGAVSKWISEHQEVVLLVGKVAASVTGLGMGMIVLGTIMTNTATVIGGVNSALLFLAANPAVAAVVAIAAVTAAVVYFTSETAKLSDAMATAIQYADQQRKADAELLKELQGLADKQGLTNDEMDRAEAIVKDLETRYSDLGVTVDRTTGQIIGMGKALENATKQMQERTIEDLNWAIGEAEENIASLNRELNSFGTSAKGQFAFLFSGERDLEAKSPFEKDLEGRIKVEEDRLKLLQRRLGRLQGGSEEPIDLIGEGALAGEAGAAAGGESPGGFLSGTSAFDNPVFFGGMSEEEWAKHTRFAERMLDDISAQRIARIENEHDRAIAAINDRYDAERKKAEELGADLELVERARKGALEAVEAERAAAQKEAREDLAMQLAQEKARHELPGAKEALLALEKKRALEGAGVDPEQRRMIEEFYALRAKDLGKVATAASPRGTFSAYALAAMGGAGGGPEEKTARNTEKTATLLDLLIGLTKEQITKLTQAIPKFT